ncbi:MAG: protein kinase [Planctomycetes bacterium]|nr:protein kinase [Planctomycetota bacterium]
MLGYHDVIYGRLLLHEGAISLPELWEALCTVAQEPARGLGETLAQGQLKTIAGIQSLEQARANLNVVLRVEEDRTLARLLNDEGLIPEDLIRQAYARSRAGGFRAGLIGVLRTEGLISSAKAKQAQERVRGQLEAGREGRAEALRKLVATLAAEFSLSEAGRLRAVFELGSGADSETQPRPERPPEAPQTQRLTRENSPERSVPLPEPAPTKPAASTDKYAPLIEVNSGGDEIRPEDCPIYGYEILSELGKGSMGVVYKARHLFSDRITALKVLPLRLAAKTQYLERFKREAMALMRIEHPNVVRGYDFGGSEDYYYLALEFVDGEPLDKHLERRGVLPEREALEITRQVALGLGAAAEHGVVHRDIKPENIMLTPGGVAKICDFGIVKLSDLSEQGVTMAGTTVGTPFYISPEQAKGEEDLDVRTDIYSLGISLFHLTTGRVPFTGKSQGAILVRHILEDVPDPRTLRPDLSEGLAGVVVKMTRKKPSDRYATPAELVADLDKVLSTLP